MADRRNSLSPLAAIAERRCLFFQYDLAREEHPKCAFNTAYPGGAEAVILEPNNACSRMIYCYVLKGLRHLVLAAV